jgi:hypothetical protein
MMGQLRNALRAFAFEYDDPHTVVSRLDKLVEGMIDFGIRDAGGTSSSTHGSGGRGTSLRDIRRPDPLARRHHVVPRAGALASDRRRRFARIRGGRGAAATGLDDPALHRWPRRASWTPLDEGLP